jgi:hypothetical protein
MDKRPSRDRRMDQAVTCGVIAKYISALIKVVEEDMLLYGKMMACERSGEVLFRN